MNPFIAETFSSICTSAHLNIHGCHRMSSVLGKNVEENEKSRKRVKCNKKLHDMKERKEIHTLATNLGWEPP